ncbi:hypothetical protein KUTeg_005558 [Tegillarca granosa]|uniref:Uncharacterized protein n=1 Tax=Tegillarca granosa TaxID=220873 RepID=A0ABQ9FK35_TEGGR|nr:hypothetical protein KUTeg_005558 [Tegillarca granosa]
MYRNKNTIDRFLVGRSAQTATPKLSQPQIQVSEFKPESNNAEENLCKAGAGAGPTYPDIACITEMSGIKRKPSKNVSVDNQWMRYSLHEDAVYCGPCFLFGRKDAKEKLFINPVNDWSNLSCFVKDI